MSDKRLEKHQLRITVGRLLVDKLVVTVESNPTGDITFLASLPEAMQILTEMLQLTPPAAPFRREEVVDDDLQ